MRDLKKVGIIKLDEHGGAVKGVCNPMVESFIEQMFVHIKTGTRPLGNASRATTYRGAVGIPVVKFGARRVSQDILARGIVSNTQLYSPLDLCHNASNKRSLYNLMNGSYMPKTVFNLERVRTLRFPIVVKPVAGWAGRGVYIANTSRELPFDGESCYQEHIKILHEYRYTMVKDNLIFKAERVPINEKAMSLRDAVSRRDLTMERNIFRWRVWPTVSSNRHHIARLNIAKEVMRKSGLGYAGIDLATDTNGREWLIEVNTSPGMTHNQSVLLYEAIYKDWYGREVEAETKQTLDVFSNILIEARKRYVRSDYTVDDE